MDMVHRLTFIYFAVFVILICIFVLQGKQDNKLFKVIEIVLDCVLCVLAVIIGAVNFNTEGILSGIMWDIAALLCFESVIRNYRKLKKM